MWLTFWLGEVALLDTRLESLVELGVESSLRGRSDLVVRVNVFLESLTAVVERMISLEFCEDNAPVEESKRGSFEQGIIRLTCCHCVP